VAILNAGCAVAMATSLPLSVPLVPTAITKGYKCVVIKDMNVGGYAGKILPLHHTRLWFIYNTFPKVSLY
jgi:hypothetical protein